jgi:hypothetical protein
MDAAVARRMYGLVEPIGLLPFFAEQPHEEQSRLGFRTYWDGYFASRSAPLGLVPPEVVHAIFYNFAPGEAARHVPQVWRTATPEAALAARERGCAAGLREAIGDELADSPGLARAADLLTKAASSAPTEGRPLYAAHLTLAVPEEPLARLWHAANLVREHRGDGHNAALLVHGIGGTECHVLLALAEGMPAEKFGRVHHLPAAQLGAVVDGMRRRGLVGDDGWLTDAGRELKRRVEQVTDELATPPYEPLTADELDELVGLLEPISAALDAAWSR